MSTPERRAWHTLDTAAVARIRNVDIDLGLAPTRPYFACRVTDPIKFANRIDAGSSTWQRRNSKMSLVLLVAVVISGVIGE